MRKMKQYCRRGFAMLLAFTLCMGLMQNAAFASTEMENSESAANSSEAEQDIDNISEDADDAEAAPVDVSEAEDEIVLTIISMDVEDLSPAPMVEEETTSQETTEAKAAEDAPEAEATKAAEAAEEAPAAEVSGETDTDKTEESVGTLPEGTEVAEKTENAEWDIADTERPGATPDVSHDKGTSDDKSIVDKNWEIFYDAEKDVYKITFNIAEGAEAETQIVDLTKALELLGQYAESGKQELQAAKDKVEKPVMGDVGDVPKMGEVNVEKPKEPEKPVSPSVPKEPEKPEVVEMPVVLDMPEKPNEPEAPEKLVEPEKPVQPGKPEGLDEAVQEVWNDLFDLYSSSAEGNSQNISENVLKALEDKGIDRNSNYAKNYAEYLVDKADCAFEIQVIETRGEGGNEFWFKAFVQMEVDYNGEGIPTDELIAEALAKVRKRDNELIAPEYEVDKTTDEYKAYEKLYAEYLQKKSAYDEQLPKYMESKQKYDDDLVAYNKKLAEYTGKLAEYEKSVNEYKKWLDEHGEDSPEHQSYLAAMNAYEADIAKYRADMDVYEADMAKYWVAMGAYQKGLEAYNLAKAEIEAKYAADVAAYKAKKAEIEAKYADDRVLYDAELKKLEAEFERRIGANVLEPGDIKKFELFITSDSQHTYKYQSGSFTLATPGWTVNPDGTVVGFDGQILPDEYVDHNSYYVTMTAKPMQDLFKSIGMEDPTNPLNKWNLNGKGEVALSRDGEGNIVGYAGYWDAEIKKALAGYSGDTLEEQLNAYILDYYNKQDGTTYTTLNDLIQNNPKAQVELTKTTTNGNKWFTLDKQNFVVDAHTATVKYDTFYKQLFSFAFGDEDDIKAIFGDAKFNEATNRWEYGNKSWTNNDYQLALYYYMDHKEIWQKTDAYFNALLDSGLSADKATWTSLMMVLNIDGVLTGNDWQDTQWPWYSSIGLERMDIDFNLNKKDGETGETITDSETEFQIYYIDKVTNEDGSTRNVNMYCTFDKEKNSYTFVTTPSTVWTENGELNISYALMKDIVYYLQEMTAPEGYERDTNIYIVMNEDDYNKLTDEDKAALEGTFDKLLDLNKSDNGLAVSTDFVNVKIVTPENPTTTPPTPSRPRNPGGTPPTPIPDPEIPLAEIPDEDVPLASIPDEDVPLAGLPKTGEASHWHTMTILSVCCLLAVELLNKKKREEESA